MQSGPLPHGVPLVSVPGPRPFALAAGEEDVSAVEAQVLVGFAAVPPVAELEPQRAAAAALLQVTDGRE